MERVGELPLLDDDPPDEGSEETEEQRRQRKRLERVRKLMQERAVPFRATKIIVSGKLFQTKALDLLESWQSVCARAYGGLLIVSSEYGHGKTVMATKAVIDGPMKGYPFGGTWPRESEPRFIAASALAFMSPYQNQEFNDLLAPSVLAIDDCGAEFADTKGMLRAKVNHIVNHRIQAPCWTVITTNLKYEDFVTRFGDRIAARVQEAGSVFKRIDDRDYRKGD